MIGIVDYGMGNLRSVQKACEHMGTAATICDQPDQLHGADKLILPGVGAFRDAIAQLRSQNLAAPVCEHIQSGKPFLGICLGLHLLFETGYEDGEWKGLGILPGRVVRFDDAPGLKIPHMGWNTLQVAQETCPLLNGIPAEAHFYFVHSYHVVPDDASVIAARTDHGTEFVSMIARENCFATQFHPEKSQSAGLKLLSNFLEL